MIVTFFADSITQAGWAQAAAIIAAALITSIITYMTTRYAASRQKRLRHRSDFSECQEFVGYLKEQMTTLESQMTVFRQRVQELELDLVKEKDLSQRRFGGLMQFSRKYNEDISTYVK